MKKALIIACLLGGLSVILGAFGAHYLKEKLEPVLVAINRLAPNIVELIMTRLNQFYISGSKIMIFVSSNRIKNMIQTTISKVDEIVHYCKS